MTLRRYAPPASPKTTWHILLLPVWLMLLPARVLAQPTPGQLLQDIRTLQPQAHELPIPSAQPGLQLSPDDSAPSGQIRFVVRQFILEGHERLGTADLQPALADLLDKPITYDDLRQATQALADLYRVRGLLARAVLPPQDITDGQVIIRIIESHLGGLDIDNRSQRLNTSRIQAWFDRQIRNGQIIDLQALDHALLTLGDLPTVSAEGYLQEGDAPGQTVLAVRVEDKPAYYGQALADNFGDKNTGTVRASAQLNVNGVFGPADQFTLYGLHTQASDYVRLGWTTTTDHAARGQRIGWYASSMDYRITSSAFQSANIRGTAEVIGFEATDPVIRSRTANALVSIHWAHSRFSSWSDGVYSPDRSYGSAVGQFGISGNRLDDWLGGGVVSASLMASLGSVDRLASADTNQVGGLFSKLRYGWSRTHSLRPDLSLHFSLTGQIASQNLDSSEQIYLGGPLNVRAHASGQGAASQGQLYTLELRQQVSGPMQLALFYDEGHAQTWKFNPTTNNVDNHYTLRGAGLSLTWQGPQDLQLKAIWAQRTGALGASVSNALAQSGGLDRNRFWLSASVPF